ncbi:MAG: hypothetical protein EKK42_32855 [Pseudonocardiaceae bacterium]|nr:MAG: hypothetical protein EKK42_32855 [Pseudonocardiaceae bacterium]
MTNSTNATNVKATNGKRRKIDCAALKPYLAAGYGLIPLHKPDATRTTNGKVRKLGKAPLDSNWTTRKYNPRAVAKRCIADQRNVGVRLTSEQLVLDVDKRHGGLESLKKLVRDCGLDLKSYPVVRTGGGGVHIYMTKPAHVAVVDSLPGYPGIEAKSAGRQVLAAGSVHPETGRRYVWDETHPSLADAPEVPRRMIPLIHKRKRFENEGGGQYTNAEIAKMLAGLNPEDYQDESRWRNLMMSVHHASHGDAREEFIEWSIGDPKYANDADVIGRRWDSLHREKQDAVTYRTLVHELREHDAGHLVPLQDASRDFTAHDSDDDPEDLSWLEGEDDSSGVPMTVEQRGLKLVRGTAPDTFENALCAVAKSSLAPAWNELKQCVEFRAPELPWPEHYGRVLTDHVLRLARHYLLQQFQGVAYQPGKDHLLEAVMTLAYQAKFNPILDYLDGLRWDGTPRVERLFADYFKCGDDAYTRNVARCFLIGAVRRQRQPGCKFDTMPVIHGAQGWGKSTGVQALFSAPWFSDADMGNLADKDSVMKLRGIWVQEWAELDSLSRAATALVKAFVSRGFDRQRDPYDRLIQDVPRRCVFIGTTNEGGFLKDATGARRFWPLELREPVDIAAIERDRNQMWAEAAALEATRESDVLPKKLWAVAAERQARQTSEDPWADVLESFLAQRPLMQPEEDGAPLPADKVHTSELFDALNISERDQTRDKSQRIRTVMEQALRWHYQGPVRVLGKLGRGYVKM